MTASGIATVARQEFRLRIRAGRWRWLLGIWFAILAAFTLLLRGALSRGFTNEDIDSKGTVVYGGLMLFVLGLALLVVPALAAQSVNGDRERGTLATLQVTRLSAAEITFGKFAAAWVTALVFLGLTLPLVVFAMTQKGVPIGRVVVVTLVIAVLLGTVCAISLALSALLSRTTTSGVLAYLSVFALAIGTLIVFGLVTAVTTEEYTDSYENSCPTAAELPPDMSAAEREQILSSCVAGRQTFTATRARTDRTWWLLAPNPFVILADAAPALPEETEAQRRAREAREARGEFRTNARDLDPLGQIGSAVRDLREAPADTRAGAMPMSLPEERKAVWPWGLAANVVLAAGALWLTTRRLHTPSRTLPRGQRVA
ncbi:MAG: ABC transporter permease [Mycobacteriales bacterium]|nr:ABC transporter permease [Mycobacteriales bacterium]